MKNWSAHVSAPHYTVMRISPEPQQTRWTACALSSPPNMQTEARATLYALFPSHRDMSTLSLLARNKRNSNCRKCSATISFQLRSKLSSDSVWDCRVRTVCVCVLVCSLCTPFVVSYPHSVFRVFRFCDSDSADLVLSVFRVSYVAIVSFTLLLLLVGESFVGHIGIDAAHGSSLRHRQPTNCFKHTTNYTIYCYSVIDERAQRAGERKRERYSCAAANVVASRACRVLSLLVFPSFDLCGSLIVFVSIISLLRPYFHRSLCIPRIVPFYSIIFFWVPDHIRCSDRVCKALVFPLVLFPFTVLSVSGEIK